MRGRRQKVIVRGLTVLFLGALAACGGGGSSSGGDGGASAGDAATPAPAGAVASKMLPQLNGWSFPNFPSATFPDLNFDTADLVSMFGTGADVCVDGVAEPCTLTAEAAAWARMVNQARATGHCEGLVALASARFNKAELPETVKLPSEEEEIRAVLRAFATQFVPEVQESIQKWTKASLAEKVDELKRSFASEKLEYTLGVYVEGGGHAILPYAIEYPTPDVARIMVYDSNWPGRNRYVDVDMKAEKWTFSFAGEDPANDPNAWTGSAQDMDLTPFEARQGTCPFCGDGTKLNATTLLVRTDDLGWSVETPDGSVSPTSPESGDGTSARPVKGGVILTRLAPRATDRSSYDYMITIPNELLDGGGDSTSTTSGDQTSNRAKLNFTGASSVFAVMQTGVAQFTTPGGDGSAPVEVGTTSIKSNDPNVDMTLAAGNLVANASGPSVELGSTGGDTLAVAVTTATGEVIQQQVTPETPALQIKADESGGVTVLQETPTGEVQKTEIAVDGTKTESIVDSSELNLNKVEVELPPALESKPLESLPKLEDRNLNNPNYKADEAYVAPTTVPSAAGSKQEASGATSTTAARSESSTTAATRSGTVATTTTAPRSVNAASATPTTVLALAKPTLTSFRIDPKTFGDGAFTVDPPDSNSPGGFRYTSSKPDVAAINATTGRITIFGSGSTSITATQAAARGFEAGTISTTLVVGKARPVLAASKDIAKSFGDEPFAIKDPESDSTGAITLTSNNESVLKQSKTSGRWVVVGAGRAVINVSQVATDDFFAATDSFVVTVRRGTPNVKPPADISKSFTDVDFDLPRPTSDSRAAFSFTSADPNILTVTPAGRATIKSSGVVTVTAAQATTDDWLATSTTFRVTVARSVPTLGTFANVSKTFGDASFTLTPPQSNSPSAFTFSSGDATVATVGETTGRVTIVGAGSAIITARQAETSGFSATSATATITVDKAGPTISDLLVLDRNYGDPDFTLEPTSNSRGKFTYSTDKTSVFDVDADTGTVKIVGVGTATLIARQAATANYTAGSVSASVTVRKGTPTYSWVLEAKSYGDDPFDIAPPTSTSTGGFTYTSSNVSVATITTGGRVTIVGSGSATITANQAANAFHVASSTTAMLTIDKASPVLTDFTVPPATFGDAPFTLTPPSSSAPVGPDSFVYELAPSAPSDVATVSSAGLVTILKPGSTVVRVRQLSSDNYTSASTTSTLTVAKASQVGGSTDGLVARWSFDSLAALTTNTQGSGNLVTAGSPTWNASGRFGGALALDGSSYLRTADSSPINGLPIGDSAVTQAAWFKADATGDRGIIGWGNYGSGRQVNALRLAGNGFRHYWWGDDLDKVPTPALSTGVWYHVAVTYDGTIRRMYLNGTEINTRGKSAPNGVTSVKFAIGATNNFNERFMGLLDDVAVYNRALTAQEVATLASSEIGGLSIASTSTTYGTPLTLTTSGGKSSASVTFEVTSSGTAGCSIDGDVLTATSGGTCHVRASREGDDFYLPVSTAATEITVSRAEQVSPVVVTSTSAEAGTDLVLTASGGSGTGEFSFAVSDAGSAGCSVVSGKLVTTAAGVCKVIATRAGDVRFLERSSVATSVTVSGRDPGLIGFGGMSEPGLAGVRYNGYFGAQPGGPWEDDVNWFATAQRHGETALSTQLNGFSSNADLYSWEWTGWFLSHAAGEYEFCTSSDDASYVWVGSNASSGFTRANAIAKAPGIHGGQGFDLPGACGTIEMAADTPYAMRVQLGEYEGGDFLELAFRVPGGDRQHDGTGYFFSEGPIRVTTIDAPFDIIPPSSMSDGLITYSSSDDAIASIDPSSGVVTVHGVGSATLTASQSASGVWAAASTSVVITVSRAEQVSPVVVTSTSAEAGTDLVLTASGGSGTGEFSFAVSDAGSAGCSVVSGKLVTTAAGVCKVIATRAGDDMYFSATSSETSVTVSGRDPGLIGFGGMSEPGLAGVRYNGYFGAQPGGPWEDDVNWFATAEPHGDVQRTTDFSWFTSSSQIDVDRYSWQWVGGFKSQAAGNYELCVSSDDASYIWIGPEAVSGFTTSNALAKSPGIHPTLGFLDEGSCGTISLAADTSYPIRMQFGEYEGGDAFSVQLTPPGGSPTFDGTGYYFSPGVRAALGDAPFTIVAPSSLSSGVITYSSSDATVASIDPSSGVVTVHGVGSAVLTASQAASGIWAAASTSVGITVSQLQVGLTPGNGLTALTPGQSAVQLKNEYGYTGSGNYWIKPVGYSGPAELVWCDFDHLGGGWVLIGKGRQSDDNNGGWFGTENAIATSGLVSTNAKVAGISKLSSEFVNRLMNGTSNGWDDSRAENYMVVNRISDAEDGYGGVGDSFSFKVKGNLAFKWVDQFGTSKVDQLPNPRVAGSVRRHAAPWLADDQTYAVDLTDNLFDSYYGGNNGTRLFTWHWSGHGSYHGWSAGQYETRGFPAAGWGDHAIQFVQVWVR